MSDTEQLSAVRRWLRYAREDLEATETDAQTAVPQAHKVWESIVADFTNHGFEIEERKIEDDRL